MFVGIDHEGNESGAVYFAGFFDGDAGLFVSVGAPGGDAEGVGEGYEIGIFKLGVREVCFEKEVLPLADHAECRVFHDAGVDGDIIFGESAEFLDIHHETAVAGDGPDFSFRFP